jgi:hypothetical protein
MAATYRVTVHRRGRTEKTRHPTLAEALDALEGRLRELAAELRPQVERAFGREYEPVRQVAARGELRGPKGLRAGVDGEDAYRTLRRVAGAGGG